MRTQLPELQSGMQMPMHSRLVSTRHSQQTCSTSYKYRSASLLGAWGPTQPRNFSLHRCGCSLYLPSPYTSVAAVHSIAFTSCPEATCRGWLSIQPLHVNACSQADIPIGGLRMCRIIWQAHQMSCDMKPQRLWPASTQTAWMMSCE